MSEAKDGRQEEVSPPVEPLDADGMARLLATEQRIRRGWPRTVEAGGRRYRVRAVPKGVRARINALELEAYMLSGRQKDAATLREAKRMQRKLDRLHAKTAAYYLLGLRAVTVPGLWWLTWRRLMWRTEEEIAAINNAAVNDEEINFSSANWDVTKLQLALSMRPIGAGVRETLQRWEAARQQANEDATKKKEGEGTSGASSRGARRMRK